VESQRRKTSIVFFPFVIVWTLFSFFMKLTGRVVSAIIGLGFMIVGITLSVTLVAAPVGIPLAVFGFLLMLRSVF
jgi:hypothetical protein